MDLYCGRCGEPYDIDYVWHDAPEDFKFGANKSDIRMCPACEKIPDKKLNTQLSDEQKGRNFIRSELAGLFGDDPDGLACDFEDFGLND